MSKSVKINGILGVLQKTCHIIFPLLYFPYLSRILGPEEFGKFNFANSIISYFLLFAMLGIQTYAIREGARIRDDKNQIVTFASQIFTLNFILAFCVTLLLVICVFCIPSFRCNKFYYLILGLIIPFTCLGRDWLNSIYEDYLYITIRYIAIQIMGLILIYTFVKNKNDCLKYTIIYSFTNCIGNIINFFYTKKYVKIKFTNKIQFKRHILPLMLLFCGQLATTIYINSDITMLGIFKNDNDVGIYSVSSKIYVLVKSMINALITVTIPRIVYYLGKDENKYNIFCSKLLNYLLFLLFPIMTGLFFEAKNVLQLISGSEYLSGLSSLRILSITLFMAVLSGYLCNGILIPNRKEKKFLIITVIAACTNIILNLVFIPIFGMNGAAITTFISETVVFVLAFIECKKYVKINVIYRNLLTSILGCLFISIICILVNKLELLYYFQLIIAIILSVIVYFFVEFLLKNPIVKENLSRFRRNK